MNAQMKHQALTAEKAEIESDLNAHRESQGALLEQAAALKKNAESAELVKAEAAADWAQALEDHAAGRVDADVVVAARNEAARTRVEAGRASTAVVEVDALQAAVESVERKMAPLGLRIAEINSEISAVKHERLRELAADLAARHRASVDVLADQVAEGMALNQAALLVGGDPQFGPLEALPVVSEGLGGSGRVVASVDERRKAAAQALLNQLNSEGFAVAQ